MIHAFRNNMFQIDSYLYSEEDMMKYILVIVLLSLSVNTMAYERAYEQTPVGHVEIKTLPPVVYIQSEADSRNSGGRNGLFMPLFRYIDDRGISMTTPVEMDESKPRMRFFVPRELHDETLPSTGAVTPGSRPETTVLSIGVRGAYNTRSFTKGLSLLENWLAEHPEWEKAGDPYAVYWDGPYKPAFMKKSEVHIPVRQRSVDAPSAPSKGGIK